MALSFLVLLIGNGDDCVDMERTDRASVGHSLSSTTSSIARLTPRAAIVDVPNEPER